MLLELHSHTSRYSKCSVCTPEDLVRRIMEKGLQGLVITEHHYLWTDDEIRQLKRDAGVGEHFLIMAGQEVDTDIGHVVVYGAKETIPERIKLTELREKFPDAALLWAHPFRKGRLPEIRQLLDENINAVEIISSNHTVQESCLGLTLWHKHKFNAVSGSDSHHVDTAGLFPTQIMHPVENIDQLACEIKTGHCLPFIKEIPKAGSNIVVTEVIFGTKGEDESRSRIIIKSMKDEEKFNKEKDVCKIVGDLREKGFKNPIFRIPKIIAVDDSNREIIEESQRGKILAELLPRVSLKVGRLYVRMAAQWLARLHKIKTEGRYDDNQLLKEFKRLDGYAQRIKVMPDEFVKIFSGFIDTVKQKEEELFSRVGKELVYNHGDYHPKNIIIGQDKVHDISTLFVSVIDFDNLIFTLPAFDVGYFLSQFESQLGDISKKYDKDFLKAYIKESGRDDKDFIAQVGLFKLRANLSIGAYLIKVGAGDSPAMHKVIQSSLESKTKYLHNI